MKEKLKTLAILIGLIIITGMTISLCIQHRKLTEAHQLIDNFDIVSDHRQSPPDTVYKVIQIPEKLETQIIPSTVIMSPERKNDNTSSNAVSAITDSVAAVELNKGSFKFTFKDSLGRISQLDYQINPDKYRYTWVDGQLTASKLPWHKKVQFKPFIDASYRPINNLADIEAGIRLKTNHLIYSVGINGFYYPKFQKNPGWDVKLNLQYEF